MQSKQQKENQLKPTVTKFGNRIKGRVNSNIVSKQIEVLQISNMQMPEIPLTPIGSLKFEFTSEDNAISESSTSLCLKRTKSVKFNETPCSKLHKKTTIKKHPTSILKNSSVDKSNCSILSGSRNLSNNSFYSNANTQRSKLSATDSVVQDQRQIIVQKNKYTALLDNLIYRKQKYFDDLFPPGQSSIYLKHNTPHKYEDIKWMRISQLFKKYNQKIYSNQKCLRNQILSGSVVEMPYLVTGFRALDTSIRCLERIFQDQKTNDIGLYCIRIFVNGIWKYILIDDFIPTIKVGNSQEPAFLKVIPKNNTINIWPFLVQKAYAKIYSSYQSLIDGNLYDFMNQLTGASIQRLVINADTSDRLKSYYSNSEYIIILGQKQQNKILYYDTDNGRSQGFISTFLIDQVVKINNKQYEIPQIIDNFCQAIVAKINQTYYSVSCTIQQSKDTFSVREFKIESTTFCDISLIQKDLKYFKKNGYKYSWMRIIICMKQNEGYRYITGAYSQQKYSGDYYVILIADWINRVHNVCLTYNGTSPVQFQRKTLKQVPNILQQTAADIAQRFGQFNQLSTNLCSYRYIDLNLAFLIQNINNQNNTRDVALIKSYGQVLKQIKMLNRIKCFDKQFIEQKYTLTKKIKPKNHYTLLMLLPGQSNYQHVRRFVFDQ